METETRARDKDSKEDMGITKRQQPETAVAK